MHSNIGSLGGSVRGGRFGSSTCFSGFGAIRLSIGSNPSSISEDISSSRPLSGSNKSSSFCFCTLRSSELCSIFVTKIKNN